MNKIILSSDKKTFLVVIAFVLAFLVTVMSIFGVIVNNQTERTFDTIQNSARLQIEQLQRYFNDKLDVLNHVADIISTDETFSERDESWTYLKSIRDMNGFYLIGLADENGYAKTTADVPLDVSKRKFFTGPIAGNHTVDYMSSGRLGGASLFFVAVPVKNENGKTVGALWASIPSAEVASIITYLDYTSSENVIICNKKGEVLALSGNASEDLPVGGSFHDMLENAEFESGASLDKLLTAAAETFQEVTFKKDGKREYMVIYSLGISDWLIVNTFSYDYVLGNSRFILVNGIILILLLSVMFLALGHFFFSKMKKGAEVLRQEKELLRQSEERYSIIERMSNAVLFEVSLPSNKITLSQQFADVFGFQPDDCELFNASSFKHLHPDDIEQFFAAATRAITNNSTQLCDARLLSFEKEYTWTRIVFVPIDNERGEVMRLIGKITNDDYSAAALAEYKYRSEHDSLTGIYNRATLKRNIDDRISISLQNDLHALVFIDVDDFKSINDTFGHMQGDNVLKLLASVLAENIAGKGLYGRISGDEFMVFLEYVESEDAALKIIQALSDAFTARARADKIDGTVSIGVAFWKKDGKNFDELFVKSDIALYHAKNCGKSCVAVYEKEN